MSAAMHKTSKADLGAIYQLEFYRQQKNWKFCSEVRKQPPKTVAEHTVKAVLNKTYDVESPSTQAVAALNQAFIKPKHDTPTTKPQDTRKPKLTPYRKRRFRKSASKIPKPIPERPATVPKKDTNSQTRTQPKDTILIPKDNNTIPKNLNNTVPKNLKDTNLVQVPNKEELSVDNDTKVTIPIPDLIPKEEKERFIKKEIVIPEKRDRNPPIYLKLLEKENEEDYHRFLEECKSMEKLPETDNEEQYYQPLPDDVYEPPHYDIPAEYQDYPSESWQEPWKWPKSEWAYVPDVAWTALQTDDQNYQNMPQDIQHMPEHMPPHRIPKSMPVPPHMQLDISQHMPPMPQKTPPPNMLHHMPPQPQNIPSSNMLQHMPPPTQQMPPNTSHNMPPPTSQRIMLPPMSQLMPSTPQHMPPHNMPENIPPLQQHMPLHNMPEHTSHMQHMSMDAPHVKSPIRQYMPLHITPHNNMPHMSPHMHMPTSGGTEELLSAVQWFGDKQESPLSLSTASAFMRGAARAPHSSELDLTVEASADEMRYHANALRKLLRDAAMSPKSENQDSYSYEEVPTRDVGLIQQLDPLENDVVLAGSFRNDPMYDLERSRRDHKTLDVEFDIDRVSSKNIFCEGKVDEKVMKFDIPFSKAVDDDIANENNKLTKDNVSVAKTKKDKGKGSKNVTNDDVLLDGMEDKKNFLKNKLISLKNTGFQVREDVSDYRGLNADVTGKDTKVDGNKVDFREQSHYQSLACNVQEQKVNQLGNYKDGRHFEYENTDHQMKYPNAQFDQNTEYNKDKYQNLDFDKNVRSDFNRNCVNENFRFDRNIDFNKQTTIARDVEMQGIQAVNFDRGNFNAVSNFNLQQEVFARRTVQVRQIQNEVFDQKAFVGKTNDYPAYTRITCDSKVNTDTEKYVSTLKNTEVFIKVYPNRTNDRFVPNCFVPKGNLDGFTDSFGDTVGRGRGRLATNQF